MAKNDKKDEMNQDITKKSKVSSMMDSIRNNLGNLYRNTYMTNNINNKDLNDLKSSIDGSIDNIISNTETNTGNVSMSKIYTRLMANGEKVKESEAREMEDMFSDKAVTDGFLMDLEQNKCIKDYDEDIDILCRYMPILEDTIDALKDNILSADHFSKDFINVQNKSNVDEEAAFSDRIENLKKKYNLLELFEERYYTTAKYGETYTYMVPYKDAFNKLLSRRNKRGNNIVNESFAYTDIAKENDLDFKDEDLSNKKINLIINTSGILESAILEYKKVETLTEAVSYKKFDSKIVPDDTKFEGLDNDGFTDINKASSKKLDVKIPGTIVKKLDREKIVPVYIEDICFGYYYIECDFDEFDDFTSVKNPLMNIKHNKTMLNRLSNQKSVFLRQLSHQMSQKIDAAFINNNQDISKELYMVLSQADIFEKDVNEIRITFLPADDVIHTYLKKDPITHRGISVLHNSITMAKLYTSIYLTDVTGILTRSQDKRVYYVKQNVDTNISKVLLNTLNQIKKSNMGAREFASAKNMLNIVGKYNDYVIPVGPSGAPIEFEIMQGQDIQIKTDLLDILEQGAVNATGVPYEFMQSRKMVDYAIRLTMSNGKFLRRCFKDQAIFEGFFSDMMTRLYNNEYDDNDELEVILPPPTFLSLLNTNQIMDSNKQYAQSIIEMECGDIDDQALIATINRKVQRHILGTYVDGRIYDIINQAKMEYKINKPDEEQ